MTTTFETAKVGDRVWCIERGWGVIKDTTHKSNYPILVMFGEDMIVSFKLDGTRVPWSASRTLFWDEVVIEAPVKPMPVLQVDAKVLVWMDGSRDKYCRHFSHFENNNIYVFDKGLSSWTGNFTSAWDYWELHNEN